jgi:quercetin dioxygenase-like cupin family protein
MHIEENELAEQLMQEGYVHLYVSEDAPGAEYPDHTHRVDSAHIILAGEMSLTANGETKTYRVGERCDVLAGAVHSAKMGPSGCKYLIAER